jgi:hypothetical protein
MWRPKLILPLFIISLSMKNSTTYQAYGLLAYDAVYFGKRVPPTGFCLSTYQTTQRHNQVDHNFDTFCHEKLKFHMISDSKSSALLRKH